MTTQNGYHYTQERGTDHLIPIKDAVNRILRHGKAGQYDLNGEPHPQGWVVVANGRNPHHVVSAVARGRCQATENVPPAPSPNYVSLWDAISGEAMEWADDQAGVGHPDDRVGNTAHEIAYSHRLMELMERRRAATRR